ncbi:MAG: hypothetical protein HQL40_19405 [Alphaproteobacteria bacterium]|nr:hypothetical protein [Alphaproteobacteria bacterium]
MALSAPELLTASHDVSQFACGKPALDHWLKTRALANQQKGFTVVLVVHEAGRVVGYHGLAPTAIVPAILPRSIRTGQPPDPVPCLLLGFPPSKDDPLTLFRSIAEIAASVRRAAD